MSDSLTEDAESLAECVLLCDWLRRKGLWHVVRCWWTVRRYDAKTALHLAVEANRARFDLNGRSHV